MKHVKNLFVFFGIISTLTMHSASGMDIISFYSQGDEPSPRVRLGFDFDKKHFTVAFPSEEAPEHIQGENGENSYVVYKLAAKEKVGYQFTHFGVNSDGMETFPNNYIENVKDQMQKDPDCEEIIVSDPSTREDNNKSYTLIMNCKDNKSVYLFCDFYLIDQQAFVISQLGFRYTDKLTTDTVGQFRDESFFSSASVQQAKKL